MQLNQRPLGRVSQALGLLTANLFVATGLHAQEAPSAPQYPSPAAAGSTVNDDTQSDLGLTRIDSAVLFYQEAGGRVKATEPVVSAALNASNGDALSMKFTSDTLTGATPNGAMPWKAPQTFVTPAHRPGTTSTVTSASGGSTIVTIPGTGTIARQYVVAPNTLPVDPGFKDQRFAIDAGYSMLFDPNTHLSVGGGASTERDYSAYSVNAGVSEDFNQKRTTASLAAEFEYDISRPYFGTPRPFTVMSGDPKGGNASKTVSSLVVGVTQVINRYWLAQLSYSVGSSNGYQTDPYRVISVVDGATGGPTAYLYENRPNARLRQSLYFGNKLALGPTFADVSARVYQDSWGVRSITGEIDERVPITARVYVEPQVRYYTQTAASFFRNYLIVGQPLPKSASSDSRLGQFNAITGGVKFGFAVTPHSELYLQTEYYRQSGNNHPAGAVGDLATENLFSGVSATSVIFGYTFAFY